MPDPVIRHIARPGERTVLAKAAFALVCALSTAYALPGGKLEPAAPPLAMTCTCAPGSTVGVLSASGPPAEAPGTPDFWFKMSLGIFLVLVGGLFAGLTIGLMSQDETHLEVLACSDNTKTRRHATRLLDLLRHRQHWILITLLLSNVVVNETLPIILHSLFGSGLNAVIASTVLIVVFGEIIPQAICARYGLAIGSFFATPVTILMYIISPIAYPIACLLDWLLGAHSGVRYGKDELKTLVALHRAGKIGDLTKDEVTILQAVLDLQAKPVSEVMTPLADVYTLTVDDILDEATVDEIAKAGYSRVPIRKVDGQGFEGMLLVKLLIAYDPEDKWPVSRFHLSPLPETGPNTSCLDILNFFQEGRSHMALVTTHEEVRSEDRGRTLFKGVITLEDVIEELIGEEIVDETDVYVDVHNKVRVVRTLLPRARRTAYGTVSVNLGQGSSMPRDAIMSEVAIQVEAEGGHTSPLIPLVEENHARVSREDSGAQILSKSPGNGEYGMPISRGSLVDLERGEDTGEHETQPLLGKGAHH